MCLILKQLVPFIGYRQLLTAFLVPLSTGYVLTAYQLSGVPEAASYCL